MKLVERKTDRGDKANQQEQVTTSLRIAMVQSCTAWLGYLTFDWVAQQTFILLVKLEPVTFADSDDSLVIFNPIFNNFLSSLALFGQLSAALVDINRLGLVEYRFLPSPDAQQYHGAARNNKDCLLPANNSGNDDTNHANTNWFKDKEGTLYGSLAHISHLTCKQLDQLSRLVLQFVKPGHVLVQDRSE